MNIKDLFLSEWSHETGLTRTMLERAPEEHYSWRPHEKSTPLGLLCKHIAEISYWAPDVLTRPDIDFVKLPAILDKETFTKAEVLEIFEVGYKKVEEIMAQIPNDAYTEMWAMKINDHEFMKIPRFAGYQGVMINHIIHHRGQLSVYLRLLNIPVPASYGPSADDNMGM